MATVSPPRLPPNVHAIPRIKPPKLYDEAGTINLDGELEMVRRLAATDAKMRRVMMAIEVLAARADQAEFDARARAAALNRLEIGVARLAENLQAINETVSLTVAAVRRVINKMEGRGSDSGK